MVADEIQTGLMRTGALFNVMKHKVKPDLLIMGKALGGGVLPISAVAGINKVMNVFKPGDHGSTFGGNPLACHVALAALEQLDDKKLEKHVNKLGKAALNYLKTELKDNPIILDIRGEGLFIGVEFNKTVKGKDIVLELLKQGIITKDTHEQTIRIAPPLTIKEKNLQKALERFVQVIKQISR